jgi:hypothetical protein
MNNSKEVIGAETLFDPLKIKAQESGNVGTQLPDSSRKIHLDYLFFDTIENKLYGTMSSSQDQFKNEFEACISLRKGNFNWIELIYDPSTEKRSQGEVITHKNNIEYPDKYMYDVHDMINNIYMNFNINNENSKQLFISLQSCKNKERFIDVLESFTNCKFSDDLIDKLDSDKSIMPLLMESMKGIVFHNWLRENKLI